MPTHYHSHPTMLLVESCLWCVLMMEALPQREINLCKLMFTEIYFLLQRAAKEIHEK